MASARGKLYIAFAAAVGAVACNAIIGLDPGIPATSSAGGSTSAGGGGASSTTTTAATTVGTGSGGASSSISSGTLATSSAMSSTSATGSGGSMRTLPCLDNQTICSSSEVCCVDHAGPNPHSCVLIGMCDVAKNTPIGCRTDADCLGGTICCVQFHDLAMSFIDAITCLNSCGAETQRLACTMDMDCLGSSCVDVYPGGDYRMCK